MCDAEWAGLWAIVLAGGERVRQAGYRSLLRQTLTRVALHVPSPRIVLVTQASHARHLAPVLAGFPEVPVLYQPLDRGTAAGVIVPAHRIRAQDPRATVVVFPTDRFVLEEAAFMRHVAEVATYAREHPDWLVLLGAAPSAADPGCVWIEPGPLLDWAGPGPVHRVRAFREPATAESARELFARGALRDTAVFAARVEGLIEAGLRSVPLLHDRLVRLGVFEGTRYETGALHRAYLFAPALDFSPVVLQSAGLPLAVAESPPFTWCDLVTPERVARSLATLRPSA